MSPIYFKHINDFLSKIDTRQFVHCDFCIVRVDSDDLKKHSYLNAYTHDFFEVSLTIGYKGLLSNEGEIVDDVEYNVSFASPGQVVTNEWEEVKYNEAVRYMILFKPEFLTFDDGSYSLFHSFPYFNNTVLSSYKLKANLKTVFKESFDDLYNEYQLGKNSNVDILRSYLTILLFKAKRSLLVNPEVSFLRSRRQEITYDFENLIKQTRQKHKPIQYYADRLNISAIYLSECIKKVTTKTAKQIIDEYLILEAKSLLKRSNHTIFEIANRLGFENDSTFVKYFRKQTGLTPKQFKIYT